MKTRRDIQKKRKQLGERMVKMIQTSKNPKLTRKTATYAMMFGAWLVLDWVVNDEPITLKIRRVKK